MVATITAMAFYAEMGKHPVVIHTGFKNRVGAVFHWAISFVGRGRAERAITLQQVRARRLLEFAARPR